jgi:hypothetical protein
MFKKNPNNKHQHHRLHTDSDTIHLTYGNHEIPIQVGYRPTEVLTGSTGEGVPVCHGDLNYLATEITDDGFVLYAKIKMNQASIVWVTVI